MTHAYDDGHTRGYRTGWGDGYKSARAELERKATHDSAVRLSLDAVDDRDRARRIAVDLEQRSARALELLERDYENDWQLLGGIVEAVQTLRGDDE